MISPKLADRLYYFGVPTDYPLDKEGLERILINKQHWIDEVIYDSAGNKTIRFHTSNFAGTVSTNEEDALAMMAINALENGEIAPPMTEEQAKEALLGAIDQHAEHTHSITIEKEGFFDRLKNAIKYLFKLK